MTAKQRINLKLREILGKFPQGVRYAELIKKLHKVLPDIPVNTLHGTLWGVRQDIVKGKINDIALVEKGLYALTKYTKGGKPQPKPKIKEEEFYKPFAEYLVNDLEECTKAIPLGGNKFGDKWGTPDVLGVYKFFEADPIKPPLEIVSAEIKTDVNQLITAFGQACAYKLFSHKVYLVIPKHAEQEISRLESLCFRFSIGLILFDPTSCENPDFTIRTRAGKNEPDYFYVNKYIKMLSDEEIKKLL
jgi:hypothetical protein